jgi:hypothetical protein
MPVTLTPFSLSILPATIYNASKDSDEHGSGDPDFQISLVFRNISRSKSQNVTSINTMSKLIVGTERV